jgi:hypothetical protein
MRALMVFVRYRLVIGWNIVRAVLLIIDAEGEKVMKIDFSTGNKCRFDNLRPGDVFKTCSDQIYIVTDLVTDPYNKFYENYNAVNLEDGELNYFDPPEVVEKLPNAKLVMN